MSLVQIFKDCSWKKKYTSNFYGKGEKIKNNFFINKTIYT